MIAEGGDDASGYRLIDRTQDRDRWRRRLFDHLQGSPRYRELAGASPEEVASALGLARNSIPCEWAVRWIEQERNEHERGETYRPNRIPKTVTRAHERTIELFASTQGLRGYVSDDNPTGFPVIGDTHRTQLLGEDWDRFEAWAVQEARDAVQQMRAALEADDFNRRIQAAHEADKELQIERLAHRLTGRAGTRNKRDTDRRWCKELGIDAPKARKR